MIATQIILVIVIFHGYAVNSQNLSPSLQPSDLDGLSSTVNLSSSQLQPNLGQTAWSPYMFTQPPGELANQPPFGIPYSVDGAFGKLPIQPNLGPTPWNPYLPLSGLGINQLPSGIYPGTPTLNQAPWSLPNQFGVPYSGNGTNGTTLPIPQFGQIPNQPNLNPTPWNPYTPSSGVTNQLPFGIPYSGTPQFGPSWNPYTLKHPTVGQLPSGYPQQIGGAPQPQGVQDFQPPEDSNGKIAVEIIDVSPEYQRQLLGWPSQSGDATSNDISNEGKWTVDIEGDNSTVKTITKNYSIPVVQVKNFVTSVKRTLVYDSTKPGNFTPIKINLYNGVLLTTTEPPTTTENEAVDPIDSWLN